MAAVGACVGALPASASVFDLSFTGTGISGLLVLSLGSGSSPYTVTGVDAGSFVDIGGTPYTITGLATYAGDDQKAYFPASSSNGYVDFPGVSVSFGSGDALNLFAFNPTHYGALLQIRCERQPLLRPLLRGHGYRCCPGQRYCAGS